MNIWNVFLIIEEYLIEYKSIVETKSMTKDKDVGVRKKLYSLD